MPESLDVVALLPGFLGFDQFGGFRYFADRVSAALRGVLSERLGRAVPVVPLTTRPTATLAQRQVLLLALLDQLDAALEGNVGRLHLVGHSSGGVDAWLLTCRMPVCGPTWEEIPHYEVRRKIASVTAIASPHHGTWLSETMLADLFRDRLPRSLEEGRLALRLFGDTLGAAYRTRLPLAEAIVGGALAWREALKFVLQTFLHRELIDDLRPERMERLRLANPPDGQVRRRSFVTMVRRDDAGPRDGAGRFFLDFYDATATVRHVYDTTFDAARRLRHVLEHEPGKVVGRSHVDIERLARQFEGPIETAACVNDGIVNSVLQLADPTADDGAELAGIVIGDHADVLGHYDRIDPYVAGANGGRPLNTGFFRSGSRFSDDEFFAVYRLVAAEICAAIPGA